MFTVIAVEEPPELQGVGRLLRRIPHAAAISCRTEKVLDTSVGYILLDQDKRVRWNKLAEIVGTRPVLISSRLAPPPQQFRCFTGRRFPELFAVNTAIFLLEQCGIPFCNLSLGIIDRSGTRTGFAETALLHIPHVKILTEEPERLERFASEMLDTYGAPVLLTSQLDSLTDCCLLLQFDGLDDGALEPLAAAGRLPYIVRSPLLPADDRPQTNDQADGQSDEAGSQMEDRPNQQAGSLINRLVISGICPAIPEAVRPYLPPGVNQLQFLSALYEQNRCASLRRVQPESALCGGNACELTDLSNRLLQRFRQQIRL